MIATRRLAPLLVLHALLGASLRGGVTPRIPAGGHPVEASAPADAELRELRRDLRDRSPARRRRAVRRLIDRGDGAAFDLVLGSLADPDGMVADEAQLALGSFEVDGALERALGRAGLRSRDPWTALRAAEALGRWPSPVPLRSLVAALDRRRPEFTRALLWSIERLAAAGRLGTVQRGDPWRQVASLTGRRSPDPVRAAALSTLAAGAPARARAALEGIGRGAGPETRAAALGLVLGLGHGDGPRALATALGDEAPSVRAAAARLAGAHADRTVLEALVDRLEVEPRPCVRDAVVRALGRATGLRHGGHVRSWRGALEGMETSWRASAVTRGADTSALPAGRSVAALGRMDLRSDRVAILVDFSGSLWNERSGGGRRKDALDPQVEALLESLPRGALFFLVPYTADNHPFEEEPLEATRRTVERAQRFFRRATMRGKGDVWGALELALDQPALDRVIVVTDGAPTGGRHWDIGLIGERLSERTRFRPVAVDLVLLEAPRGIQRQWAPVVANLGGRLLALER
ncbi:MAG: vWA domain-containing protein [Planctomycetota bacterium]|nr:vWA domain-containing protein [Planctomycetota bacterium]